MNPTDENDLGPDDPTSPSDVNNTSDDGDGGDDPQQPSKRSAEARINQLVQKNRDLERKLQEGEGEPAPTPPPAPQPSAEDPKVQRVKQQLKELGFVSKEDLKTELEAAQSRTALDSEHSRLEQSYDGKDGRPAYNRAEIENYMRENGIYKPDVAYKAMHEVELTDWILKSAEQKRTTQPVSERSGSSSGRRPETGVITRAKIAEEKAKGDLHFRKWYDKNYDKIRSLMEQGKL